MCAFCLFVVFCFPEIFVLIFIFGIYFMCMPCVQVTLNGLEEEACLPEAGVIGSC